MVVPSVKAPSGAPESVEQVRERIANACMILIAVLATPAFAASLSRTIHIGFQPAMVLQGVLLLLNCGGALLRHRLPYGLRAGLVVASAALVGIGAFLTQGLGGGGAAFLVVAVALAKVLFRLRVSVAVVAAIGVSVFAVGVAYVTGGLRSAFDLNANNAAPLSWLTLLLNVFLLSAMMLWSISAVLGSFRAAIAALAVERDRLEQAVAERTADLSLKLRELEEARQAAIAATRAKSAFLAHMSHEIRTPLNAVIGFSDLLANTAMSPAQRGHLGKISGSGRLLLEVVNDVLDFSKIEAGKMEVEIAPFDLGGVLARLCAVVALRAQEKNLDVFCSVSPLVPERLASDPVRLTQVLINLVGNAVKFTAAGEVFVRIEPVGRGPLLRFSVSDTGPGISAAQQAELFRPFHQADSSTTRRFGGTGLGLAIARQLAELMGGEIGVISGAGGGSTFWFTAAVAAATEAPPGPMPKRRVLVVNARRLERDRLVASLREHGHDCTAESSLAAGAAAVAAAEHPFDAVVFCAAGGEPPAGVRAQLRCEPGTATRLIYVASSIAFEESVDGDIAVLTRPLDSARVAAVVAGEGASPAAGAERHAERRLDGTRVLVVDDNPINCEVAAAMLTAAGATAALAENGLAAVAKVTADPGAFDIVLMDIQMPELDGIGATERIRRLRSADDLPVLAMSAHSADDERQRCADAGMNGFLSKPVTSAALIAAVERWVGPPGAGGRKL